MSAPTTDAGEEGETPQEAETTTPRYVIPSFLDILLDSEFRIQHKPPPLQVNETQEDRDCVDHLLEKFWDLAVSRAFLNKHDEEVGKEFTYGEVTSTGVRQLLEDMELLTLFAPPNDEEVVFYDLGSGEGKLAVQVLLETLSTVKGQDRVAIQKIVGIELSPARHEMAVHSWDQLQKYLVEGDNQDGEETLGEHGGSTRNKSLATEGEAANEVDQNSNKNQDTAMDPHKMAAAKERLQTKLLAEVYHPQCVQLVHGDLKSYDFSDATHIYASSIFFPQSVLESMSQKIMDYSKAYGKLKVVAALSDLELLEAEDAGWEKRNQRLQMSWGGANVRLYSPKDY